ncbi:DUF418 domain-containing protein [Actinomadura rudentiformis]|uniref:DUF418 domain-containing protein n=2 Tax=Actinomadura rudentiformis TaxID=359158 RepID=A0A6H9ZC17_9ACTN|nr:DUF418 domain-containing protein [Actinomadura rudentiformis]
MRGPGRRVREIDALRGLALCGILPVNIAGMTGQPVHEQLYDTVLHQRFFPIFAFLFGVGFALFLRAASAQTDHPKLVMLARLGFLLPIGLAHQMVQPGEVLLPYAIVGVLVLLPASFLPRSLVLGTGATATAAALAFAEGGIELIPGLFLLGLATVDYGVLDHLERHPIGAAFVASVVVAVPLNVWQLTAEPPRIPAVAGVVTATAYATGLLLALRTRARAALGYALEPLGRMALTNYLSATIMILAAGRTLPLVPLTLAILLVQVTASRWWLGRFAYGPAEWAWRSLTWWRLRPFSGPCGGGPCPRCPPSCTSSRATRPSRTTA